MIIIIAVVILVLANIACLGQIADFPLESLMFFSVEGVIVALIVRYCKNSPVETPQKPVDNDAEARMNAKIAMINAEIKRKQEEHERELRQFSAKIDSTTMEAKGNGKTNYSVRYKDGTVGFIELYDYDEKYSILFSKQKPRETP